MNKKEGKSKQPEQKNEPKQADSAQTRSGTKIEQKTKVPALRQEAVDFRDLSYFFEVSSSRHSPKNPHKERDNPDPPPDTKGKNDGR